MKRRVLALVLGATAALLLASAALAKLPEPPDAGDSHASQAPPYGGWLEGSDWLRRPRASGLQMSPAGSAEPQQVTVGQPGLSFRYVDTFGVTEQAYPADVQHLNRPMGLFVDGSDNLYVAENYGARVLKYRISDGANLWAIGTAGLQYVDEYVFNDPHDVALDSGGDIWVVDDHRATQYDPSGNFLQVFPDWDDAPWSCAEDDGHFCEPTGLAFDTAGRMYVSDQGNHRVQVFAFVSGSPVYSTTIGVTGTSGDDNDHFNGPGQIVIDGSDRLYVADQSNHRVQRCTYSTDWACETFHGTGSSGNGDDELSYPYGLGIDTSDNIYIADLVNGRVKKCTVAGSCSVFASGMAWPSDVAVDSSDRVYVNDWIDCTIRQYSSGGSFLSFFAGVSGVPYLTDNNHYNAPYGVAVDNSGNIYVSTTRGYRVLKLNASGAAQWALGVPGVSGDDNVHFGQRWDGPNNIAVDSTGNVYVADTGNDRVQKFNNSGSYLTTLGSSGSGNYQFDCPDGVSVDASGNIYAADSCNHRIQIYNGALTYIGRIGVTDVPGGDNSHFNHPWGVDVDSSGRVYVADGDNQRVQKCSGSGTTWTCATFAGTTGEGGDDFAHFDTPRDVAVDIQGRVYVADAWNNRVQVFDTSGAYLTTIGGEWGSESGRFRGALGLDVDKEGNVYVADKDNHRIQKFAPGVPGWLQVNINGFGDRWNDLVLALANFNGDLYAGTSNGEGGEVWRSGSEWEQVNGNGFGNSDNGGIDDLIEFDDYLYASTWNEPDGGEVWRYNGTPWSQVASGGFGDSTNVEIYRFAVFDETLYASTWSYTDTHGTEIYTTTNGTSWTRAVSNGFGDANNIAALSFESFNGYLYAGTYNTTTGGEIWRSTNGASWSQVNLDGFGEAGNIAVSAVTALTDWLYASTRHEPGAGTEVWRCQVCDGTDWTQVVANGFGNTDTRGASALEVFRDRLYLIVGNSTTGLEVWRTADGANWQQVGFAGFGDSNNRASYWDNSVAVTNDRLYIGTWNYANGGEIWAQQLSVYVPLVMKNF